MNLLFDQGGIAERPLRGLRRLAKAALALFLRLELEVDLELAIQLGPVLSAFRRKIPAHAGPSDVITEAIALASSFQRDSSFASCFRPSGVSR